MSFIDSSSALDRLAGDDEEEREHDEGDEAEIEPEPEPAKPRRRGSLKRDLIKRSKNINIARDIGQYELDRIGDMVVREFELDLNSRSDWADKARTAMDFAVQKTMPKTSPWPGASNIIFPLMIKAALDFQARTYPAIIPGRNIVKGVVIGEDKGTPQTVDGKPDGQPKMMPPDPQNPQAPPQPMWIVAPGEKRQRADLIGEHMSWQLLSEMSEWEPQTDQLLFQIPVIGGAVRKTYYEPAERKNYSLFVSLMDLVWDYDARSFEAAPRHSEILTLYPHQISEYENTDTDDRDEGMFLPLNYGPGDVGEPLSDVREEDGQDATDEDAPHQFIEQHRRLDLDDDGYSEPYTVTVHKRSAKVVRIVARYDEEGIVEAARGGDIQRIEPIDSYTLIPFLPSIDGGSYPMGFGHLLKPINEGINTTLNQMFDAGTLQNSGGGFMSKELGLPSGNASFEVGKYLRVATKGQSIRESVFPIPFPGPSQTLFQLLGFLVSAGEAVASIQDVLSGDASIANAPPTTVLALIEQGMKVNSAIHKRVFRAFGQEFQKLFALNKKHLTEIQKYRIGDEWREIGPDDYRLGGGVEPVADPSMTTDMQRLARASVIKEIAWGNPLFNQQEVATRYLEAAGAERITDLFAPPDPTQAQMAMAKAQAELGRERAAEQKDTAQAFLFMAQARALATGAEEAAIQAQMDWFRLHIEALNTQVKAAAIDHKFHDTNMRAASANADRIANAQPPAEGQDVAAPTPGPTGAFPSAPGPVAPAPKPPTPAPASASNAGLPPLPPPGADPTAGAPGRPGGGPPPSGGQP